MNLLVFFAIPIATIILAAIFQTFINCPLKIAGIAFAIFIVVAFVLGGTAELIIAAIIYTILALITALIVMIIQNKNNIFNNICNNGCGNNNNNSCGCNNNSSCGCRNR